MLSFLCCFSDHPQVSMLKAIVVFQSVTKHTIKRRMCQHHQAGALQDGHGKVQAGQVEGDGNPLVMCKVVTGGTGFRSGQVAQQ